MKIGFFSVKIKSIKSFISISLGQNANLFAFCSSLVEIKKMPESKKFFLFLFFLALIIGSLFFLKTPYTEYYVSQESLVLNTNAEEKIQHIKTPDSVKGIYMTSWVAGTKNWRAELVNFIDSTELNSIIIDVKDYTGRISFETNDADIKKIGSSENRIPDIKEFVEDLHKRGIYVIARISVFQDPFFTKKRPDLAVKTKSGAVWKDRKGIAWLDPASVEVWDYTVKIARETEKVGFDELNFDYIRFPSDGNMQDIKYSFWDEITPKAEIIKNFFAYLDKELKSAGVPLSVNLFGMTTWNDDDLNIGQILEYAAPYFDFIAPMIYPSHYISGNFGFENPAEHPYEIIYSGMARATDKLLKASSTPAKLRPWLQDFDLGAEYDAPMILLEKKAVYDAGINSWMLWDPANRYTRNAILKE